MKEIRQRTASERKPDGFRASAETFGESQHPNRSTLLIRRQCTGFCKSEHATPGFTDQHTLRFRTFLRNTTPVASDSGRGDGEVHFLYWKLGSKEIN